MKDIGEAVQILNKVIPSPDSPMAVTPTRPKGKWKRISMDKYVQHANYYYKCSECGNSIIGEYNYCPSCGADMKESDDK